MNRKQKILIAITSMGFAFLAIIAVTASSWTSNTPLCMVRMEQVSSKMNFLPTAVNEFAYITEKGYTLNYNVSKRHFGFIAGGGEEPQIPYTCIGCTYDDTCDGGRTCDTCNDPLCDEDSSVCGSCSHTCYYTCDDNTCSTCQTCSTCWYQTTCSPARCPWTQWPYCAPTLIWPTCYWETCFYC